MCPYRPRTMANYKRQLHLFVCFSIRVKARVTLAVDNLISFLEFLVACNVSPRGVSNYVCGIKSQLNLYSQPTQWMDHPVVVNYIRSLHINVPSVQRVKGTISLRDFHNISVLLDQFENSLVYRAAFALSFYGFLRISNLVPPSKQGFDPTRQLTRGDVSFTDKGVVVFLKWAKNLQKTQQTHVIMLPAMNSPWLCPVHTLYSLFQAQQYLPSDPVIKSSQGLLTESHLRKRFQLMLSMLGLPTASLTYHSLRRSGASLAFNNKVDFESIKSQGAWGSDAVYKYLFANSDMVQQVPRMFQRLETQL